VFALFEKIGNRLVDLHKLEHKEPRTENPSPTLKTPFFESESQIAFSIPAYPDAERSPSTSAGGVFDVEHALCKVARRPGTIGTRSHALPKTTTMKRKAKGRNEQFPSSEERKPQRKARRVAI